MIRDYHNDSGNGAPRDSNVAMVGTPRDLPAEVWISGRTFADLRISPNGNTISFLSRASGRSELAIVPIIGGVEQTLPLSPAPVSAGHDWMPDASGVVYTSSDGRLYRFHFDTLDCRPITPEGRSASHPTVSPDGADVAYVVNDMAAIAVTSLSGDSWPRLVSADADFTADPVWSPDSELVAWVEWNVPQMAWDASRIVVRPRDLSVPQRTVAGGAGISVQQPRFSPDGSRLTFLSDETGWLNLWTMDSKFENARVLVAETFEHGEPMWGPGNRSYAWVDNSTIVFTRNEHGWWRLLACNANSGEQKSMSSVGASQIVGGNGKAAITTLGPTTPSEIVMYDAAVATTISRATPFGVERLGIEPELVSWKANDGAELFGRLYGKSESAPMLVWTHVGPTAQSAATLYHRFLYFIERGWSVFVPDHRGSSGWGREYLQAMRGRWGELDVSDVASGVQTAIDNDWCDPSKVVAIGSSSGGFTTLLLLEKHSELFAAGVAIYPVCDLVDLTWTTHRLEAHYNDSLIGPLPECYDEYVARSPLSHAEDIRTPLLVLHGTDDPVVPLHQTQKLVRHAQRKGSFVELHVYEGEGHGWRKPENRVDELIRIETFLRRHVLRLGP